MLCYTLLYKNSMCYLLHGCVRRTPKEDSTCGYTREDYLDHFLFVDTRADCEKLQVNSLCS